MDKPSLRDENLPDEGRLPSFADCDLAALSRQGAHPVLAAVATALLSRELRGEPAVAFYEDGPYRL
ncbi:hypothetical protein OG864_15160 [Streptomyces sp. NBC_00124]|uniref:YxD-tail cyclophane-containing RiPP peptide n=1 Tax=Streptomyces sp. NBC_00124 TaxID=2975662 RepID=UPI002251A1B1|nr:YxD-tail cyclophane-containing RiPP peptide [Streptomyces sp. NBC_00124]MCX5360042.1 hypothetical protein [Streptomyces sp. NBC_00124]